MGTVITNLVLKGLDTANTYAIHDADAVLVLCLQVNAAILDSLLGSNQGQLGIAVHLTCLLAIEIFVDIEILDLTGKLGFEQGGIETGNRRSTTLTSHHILPSLLRIISKWRNGTKSCYYYSF